MWMRARSSIVLAAMPDDPEQWTQQSRRLAEEMVLKKKSGNLLSTPKVYEGRLKKLAEPIPLQEARAQNLEIVYGKWLDDVARSCKNLFHMYISKNHFHQKIRFIRFKLK